MSDRKRIMLVDDHPILREGLREIIDREEDLVVCCEAGNSRDALKLLAECEHPPDAAIVDITLEGAASGLELLRTVHNRYPKIYLLVHSMHNESFYAERCIKAGARGYVTKSVHSSVVLEALRKVLIGELYLSEDLAKRIMRSYFVQPGSEDRGSIVDALSDRELEIFELTGWGFSTAEIGEKLGVSRSTVETHRARIREKLGLKSSADINKVAVQWILAERGSRDAPPPEDDA